MSSNSPDSTRTGRLAGWVEPEGTGGSIPAVGARPGETAGEARRREGHPLGHREGSEQPGAREGGDRLIELGGALGEVGRAVPGHRVVVALDRGAHSGGEVVKVAVAGAPLVRDAIEALVLARQVLGHRPVQGKVGVRGPGPSLEQKGEGAVERAAGPLDPSERALEALFGVPGAAQLLAAAEGSGPGATGRVSRAAQLHGPHRPGVDRPPERIVGRIGGGEHHRAQARRVADRVRLGQQSPVRVAVEGDRAHAECVADGLDVGRGFRGREPLIARAELVRTRGGRDHLRDHPPLQLRAIDRLGVARAALVDQHQVAATQQRPEHRPVRLRRVEAGAGVPGSALDGEDRSERRLAWPHPAGGLRRRSTGLRGSADPAPPAR